MNKQEQIYNWLTIAIQQPAERISEMFYYDKRDNEFFSILIADYFMLDEKFNVAKDVTTSYTKINLDTLIERIRRIEDKDITIIYLPRLGKGPNNGDMEFIYKEIDSFLTFNSINIETATIWEEEQEGNITIDLTKDSKHLSRKTWWQFWK